MTSDGSENSPVVDARSFRRLTVFTGSATGSAAAYRDAVADLATSLAGRRIGLVYGGGRVGLMGVVADAALAAGGEVVGVMPRALVEREIAHERLTDLQVVADLHERKRRMADLGDAFVALPGGAGTLEELFEVWTWQQLGLHAKAVAVYSVGGFWDPLLAMLDRMVDEGFLSQDLREALIVSSEPDDLVQQLRSWTPRDAKWAR